MNKKIIKTALVAGAITACSLGFVGCGPTDDKTIPEYSIYNYDNSYYVNESFSLDGAKLKIKQKDGSYQEISITNDMIKSMPDMTNVGTKTIVIVYDDIEYSLTIEVVANQELSYNFAGFNDTYQVGDTFDISNLKLNIVYSSGNEQINVTNAMISSMPDMETEGLKIVQVNYNGKVYSFTFNVVDSSKLQMVNKLNKFLQDFDESKVHDSKLTINVNGIAKYLENNAEFNEDIFKIISSTGFEIEDADIYKAQYGEYVIYKEFDSEEDVDNYLHSIEDNYYANLEIVFVLNCQNEESVTCYSWTRGVYGSHISGGYDSIQDLEGILESYYDIYDIESSSFDDFKSALVNNLVMYGENNITITNNYLAKSVYNAIINSIIKTTTNIQNEDIISAKDQLIAKLDVLKTLNNIVDNVTNIDYYDYFVNQLLLPDSAVNYANICTDYICEFFGIEDGEAKDQINYVVTNDIKAVKNNQIDLNSVYNMIIELNDVLQESGGNESVLEKLNIIVDGIDTQNKNLVSDFVYALKDFACVQRVIEGETTSYEEATSGNRWYYDGYYDQSVYIYKYRDYVTVANTNELVEAYYTGLKNFISRFENIDENTNLREFTNTLIADLRSMDSVVKTMEENEYEGVGINFYLTSTVRMGLEYYKAMYDAEVIADIIDQLGYFLPEGYERLGTTLSDCADIIYLQFAKSAGPDYVQLIEDLCDRLGVEKDYYIEQYNNGELHLFEDFVYNVLENTYNMAYYSSTEEPQGPQEPLTSENDSYLAILNSACKYLDSLFIDGYDRTGLLDEIHSAATIYLDDLQVDGEVPQNVLDTLDIIIMLTDTQNNIYDNIQAVTRKYKSDFKEYISNGLSSLLMVPDENKSELTNIVNYHLTAYLNNQFDIGECVGDLSGFINDHCEEEVKAYSNSIAILGTIILNDNQDIDYNELLKDIELPNEIKEIDFNKLINETLKDKNTYDIFKLDDVNVEYITNDGDIVKEIMTVKLNAKYDILISSLDADIVLTFEIEK